MNRRGRKRNHSKSTNKDACVFCGEDKNDEIIYGRLYHKRGVTVHEYCMYFSSGLCQNGWRDRIGILRFQIPDIKKEVARGSKLRCSYCKFKGASVGCARRSCKKTFHFPCGLKNGCLNQHKNNFPSFCPKHKPKQKVITLPTEETICQICHVSISGDEFSECLYSPCCKNKWFHLLCLKKYAFSAGLNLFKCPTCNDKSKFVREMVAYGINVPDKEAEWESEFGLEDFVLQLECSARNCRCFYGRRHDGLGRWFLLSCPICGSNAMHVDCINDSVRPWKCEVCQSVEAAIKKRRCDSNAILGRSLAQENATNSEVIVNRNLVPTQFNNINSTTYNSIQRTSSAQNNATNSEVIVSRNLVPTQFNNINSTTSNATSSVQHNATNSEVIISINLVPTWMDSYCPIS